MRDYLIFLRLILFSLAIFLSVNSSAKDSPSWTIDYELSSITFEVKLFNAGVKGWFKNFTAEIRFDPDNLAKSKITSVVDLTSINTRNSERDAEILKPGWLNVTSYPQAEFESDHISFEDGQYHVKGVLTLRGMHQFIEVAIRLEKVDDIENGVRLYGESILDRNQFQIGEGEWNDNKVLSKTVWIKIEIIAATNTEILSQ